MSSDVASLTPDAHEISFTKFAAAVQRFETLLTSLTDDAGRHVDW